MPYIQRVKCLGFVDLRQCRNSTSLKVIDADLSIGVKSNNLFQFNGDFRANNNGDLITMINTASGLQNVMFNQSSITKVGNFNFPNSINTGGFFRLCGSLIECGDFSSPSTTNFSDAFRENYQLKKIGIITLGAACTNLNFCFRLNYNLTEIIFAGTLSGVTTINQAFFNNYSLRSLILPDITIGFDIRDTQITGQNLQDLFDSIGTADGTQTITLPNFTSGEPTGIATGKGYTIAYA